MSDTRIKLCSHAHAAYSTTHRTLRILQIKYSLEWAALPLMHLAR
jgi:hypothetical protein